MVAVLKQLLPLLRGKRKGTALGHRENLLSSSGYPIRCALTDFGCQSSLGKGFG